MSLARKPEEERGIEPLFFSDLDALKKSFSGEIDRSSQLLEKIMLNICNTVKRTHRDVGAMWQQIDFQAEAIDQIISTLTHHIRQKLDNRYPSRQKEEIELLVDQLARDLGRQYCVEDYVETLLKELSEKYGQSALPLELLAPSSTPLVESVAIAGYPGLPFPMHSWWLPLVDLSNSVKPADQGCYFLRRHSQGIEATQLASTIAVGIKEVIDRSATVTCYDDHSATLEYRSDDASMTMPILRGSPFLTFVYQQGTPILQFGEKRILPDSIQAYQYFLVVPDSQFTDSATQIPQSKATVPSEILLLRNSQELKGQFFIFSLEGDQETYLLFASTPLLLKVIPGLETESIQGLESASPCRDITIRIAKAPRGSLEKAAAELLNHAWIYGTGGLLHMTGNGQWKYTYESEQIDPVLHLRPTGQPQFPQQDLLIALLPHDFQHLEPTTPLIGLDFQTIHGTARFAIAKNTELNFSQEVIPIAWFDRELSSLSKEHIRSLANSIAVSAKRFDIKARGAPSRLASQQISDMALLSHALFTLLAQNPFLLDNSSFMEAFQSALGMAQAGLDDFLLGGLLAYDTTNKRIITCEGESAAQLSGNLIYSAAAIREISPEWFSNDRTGVIDLLIEDLFCRSEGNLHFPKMQIADPYLGLPQGEEIGIALTSLEGIACWAYISDDQELAYAAQTCVQRLRTAAQIDAPLQRPFLASLAELPLGSLDGVDSRMAVWAFETFFECDLSRFDERLFIERFPQVSFRNAEVYPALIPLIAEISPLCAEVVLEWVVQAHHRNSDQHPWRSEALYLLLKMKILIATQKGEEILSSPISQNSWPPLPQASEENPLQFWLEQGKNWLNRSTVDSIAFRLAEHVCNEIRILIEQGGTVQDLQLWAHSIVLPAIRDSYPEVAYEDLYPFCAITQTDPREVIAWQKAPSSTTAHETTEEPSYPLLKRLAATISAYLTERAQEVFLAQDFLNTPRGIPETDDEWRKLLSLAQSRLQQLQKDISSCKTPTQWTALAAKYAFQGSLREIQLATVQMLQTLSNLLNAPPAFRWFSEALDKASHLSPPELAQWIGEVDSKDLTPRDLAIWELIKNSAA
jgi:hypothetical protein